MTAVDPDESHPEAITLGLHDASPQHMVDAMADDVVLEMGWGRLIFGQTFADPEKLAGVLRQEGPGRRDICIYAREPHVLVARAPAELFIDPSHTYRLRFSDDEVNFSPTGFTVRTLHSPEDADAMNRVYVRCGMVSAPVDVIWDNHLHRDPVDYLVAVRDDDGSLVGTVTGVDHVRLFSDPEEGSSLWTLAVDPASILPGVGAALTRALAAIYRGRERAYMDLSVAHDNAAAIALYEKLGFARVPVMAVKRKNAINEPLFTHPPETVDDLNPYARIIADEAMRRGIWVEVLDAEAGEMRLSHGGRSVVTRESLSEYTSAVAMSRCDDKRLTRRIVAEAGIVVARGRLATFDEEDYSFLDEVGDVVDELLALGVRKPIESGSNRERLPVLRRRIKPLMLRRTKAQVAPELPPKQEQVLTVDLGAKHHKIYDTRLARERGGVRPQRLRPSTGPTESARRAPSQSTDWCLRAQSRSGWWRYRSASVNCSLRSSAKARCWGQPSPRRISARFWGSTRTAANQRR